MTFGQDVVPCTTMFKYLGSVIQNNVEISKDVTHQIQEGQFKWKAATEVLRDRKFLARLKDKFHRVAFR